MEEVRRLETICTMKAKKAEKSCYPGFIISKLFSCLLEWLMVIDPMILSETELCPLVFDVIQYAIHISSVR